MKKLNKKNVEEILPLTPMQQGMLFHYLKDAGGDYYSEQLSLDIPDEIDQGQFEKAWNFVIETNDMLRAVFRWEKVENPIQIILKEHKLYPTYYDFSNKKAAEAKRLLETIKAKDREEKFALKEVPFRVTLCKVKKDKYEMIISNHHILYDGWSNGIILREFFKAYDDLRNGKKLVKPVKTRFKEFVKWIQNRDVNKDKKFWEEYLKGLEPKTGIPGIPGEIKRRKAKEINNADVYRVKFPDGLKAPLGSFTRSHKVPLSALLYSAWGVLLLKYNSREDMVYDTTVSGRSAKLKGIEEIVGLFINTVPLRVKVSAGERVSDFISRMVAAIRQREEFENSSLLDIKEYLDEDNKGILFDSVVIIENYPLDKKLLQGREFFVLERTGYDLTVIITTFDDIEIHLTYNKELFSEEIIAGLAGHFVQTVHAFIENPWQKISGLTFLPGEVRDKILERYHRPDMGEEATGDDYTYSAPGNPVEEKLVNIWSGLFQVESSAVGIDTDFFDFGGHSLKASLLAGRIYKEFKVKVPLAEIFRLPTIRQMARYIKEARQAVHISIEPAEEKEYYAASPVQQRMYTLQQMEPGSIAYNVSALMAVEGRLQEENVAVMEMAFRELIDRHEVLRTSFHVIGGEPVQKIHDDVEFKIEYYDRELPTANCQLPTDFIRPFDLSRPPLFRIGLTREKEDEHLLMFDAHHIISDGTSMNVFVKEFMGLYEGEELPEPPIRYKDFSEWQKKELVSEAVRRQEAYWLQVFSGEIPVLNLAGDYPRSGRGAGRFKGNILDFTIYPELREKLRTLERAAGATLYMTLFAAYNVLLMKYSGQEDIIVGTLTDGRPHADLENVVGVLITTLAVRNYPNREKRFIDFLGEVKINSLKAFENSDYQFEELLKNIRFRRETGRNPLFDTMFLLQNYEWTGLSLEGLVFEPRRFNTNASTFDLRVTVVEVEQGIDIEIQYASRLFKEAFVRRFFGHYVTILEEAANDPAGRLGEIPLLTRSEREQVLHEFNASRNDAGEKKPVYRLFEDRVLKSPGAAAVGYEGREISYRALNAAANRLARVLRERGVGIGQPVGILLSPAPWLVIAVFAAWKAGGAYIPIDPRYPPQRIKRVVTDSGTRLMISRSGTVNPEVEKVFAGSLLLLDRLEDEIENQGEENPDIDTGLDSPAYIIYTSGSTGNPKGAGVYHRGFTNLLNWFVGEFGLNDRDGNILVTSLSFDLTQKNIYAPLISGGILTLPGLDYFEPGAILEMIGEKQITWLNCTPSMIYKIVEFGGAEELEKLSSLRYLFLGGEPIVMGLLGKWIESGYCNAEIVNTYGPTECTDICASYRIPEPGKYGEAGVPIGKPIYNVRLYIVDASFQLLPPGIPGELCIGGEGVGPGYINDTRLTSEKFINFPYSPPHPLPPSPIYRTGDLARWLADGNIEFIGRLDHQVKIRGFRIELGEIESRLLTHAKIKAAVVSVRERKSSREEQGAVDSYLCAYFAAEEKLSALELKTYLSNHLPDYMIPSYFIQLERIPLTPHGKVDRKQLPEPGVKDAGVGMGVKYVEPSTEMEKKLAQIWKTILGKETIGTGDNFFEHGGDSLLVIQVIARLREEFGVDLPVKVFFRHPVIEELAREIEGGEKEVIHIPKAPPGAEIPLSYAQEQLWFLHNLDAENISYHVPRAIRIKGKLDVSLIERTFAEIIRRHDILRTVFPVIDGHPVQRVRESLEFKLPLIDWSDMGEKERDRKIEEWLREEGQRVFDFEKGPMMRITLLKLKAEEHLLVLTEHHFIHDGWTQGVLLKEFITLFTAFSGGRSSPLPGLPIQYADYAYWQRNYLRGDVLERQLDYWREKLVGLSPLLGLPLDRPRPPVISGRGAEKRLLLSGELSAALREFGKERDATLFMTMLGVFKALLYRYTGSGDLCVGTGMANRRYKELEGMLGMVINTLALRTRIIGELSFDECLQLVKVTCLEALEYEDTPFEKVVEVLRPERSLSYTPIFQVLYSFMDTPAERLHLPGLELRVLPAHNRSAKFDINVIVEPPTAERREETGGRIEIIWEYNTDIFDDSTMQRMLNRYVRLLEEVVKHPGREISLLPIMETDEINQLLYEWNRTDSNYPKEKTVHGLFEEQAEKTPERIAVVGSRQGAALLQPADKGAIGKEGRTGDVLQLTYRELNRKSDQLAHLLREKCVLADSIVGIMVERSAEMIIGILGILKAGGAYLPIDPEYPQERIDFMLTDSNAAFLLTAHELSDIFRGSACCAPTITPAAYNLHLSLAYIIYTSGTTGKPKGVMIRHKNVVRLMFNDKFRFDFNHRDVWTLFHSYCFDFSVWEMYGALLYGGKLVVIPGITARDPGMFLARLKKEGVTVLNQTPSVFYRLIAEELKQEKRGLSLKYVIFGGEALSPGKLKEWKARYPETRLINMFGITETTVHVTFKEITAEAVDLNISNIGNPIPTLYTYVLDKNQDLVPIGVPGELCVGGEGLAEGYLNRPELTAEKFINVPGYASRLYRSGDLVKRCENGEMIYLGRIDSQVQIRGHRVELGETRSHLVNHEDIKDAVVVDREDKEGDKYLCAYVVFHSQSHLNSPLSTRSTAVELREYLSARLPGYMIPSYFVPLEQIPLTSNGKVDKRALPGPAAAIGAGRMYVAPRDELEVKLVEIWEEVLGISKEVIGIESNFFELGGHSLKAAVLAARIHKELNVNIPLIEIFTVPTVKGLAKYIKNAGKNRYTPIEPVEMKECYPLSSAQRQIYFIHWLENIGTAYNISTVVSVDGNLEKAKLEDTFGKLINRHESLRTAFELVKEEPVQKIYEEVEFKIKYYDLKANVETVFQDFFRPFDLSKAVLMRVGLIRKEEQKHILMLDMHHIISDGTSMDVFVKELMVLYRGEDLGEIRVQYKDYTEWQHSRKQREALKLQEKYWLRRFEGRIPFLRLPADWPGSALRSFKGCTLRFEINKSITGKIKKILSETGTTLYMFLCAIYNILLSKCTGQEDIIIGSPAADRPVADLENVMGMFVNMLAMRNFPSRNKKFIDFLMEVKGNALHAYENQDYPFDRLVKHLTSSGNAGSSLLINTVFTLQNASALGSNSPVNMGTGLKITPYPYEKETTMFDLTLDALEVDGSLEMWFKYSPVLFKKSTIEKLKEYYIEILEKVAENIYIGLKDILLSINFSSAKPGIIQRDLENFEF